MPTFFNMTKDVGGFNGFGLISTDDGFSGLIEADTAVSVTTPNTQGYGTYIAIFSFTPGSNVFVNVKGTATVPAVGMAASDSRLTPQARQVKAGTVISLITPDTDGAYVTVEFYICPPYTN